MHVPLCIWNTLQFFYNQMQSKSKFVWFPGLRDESSNERKQRSMGYMAVVRQLSTQHTARETWRKSWVTCQFWILMLLTWKGRKLKNCWMLVYQHAIGGKTREAERQGEPFFLHQCSNVRQGFSQEKWLGPQMSTHTQLQCLTINLETHPASDSPRGKCVEDAFVASFILEGDSMKRDGWGL